MVLLASLAEWRQSVIALTGAGIGLAIAVNLWGLVQNSRRNSDSRICLIMDPLKWRDCCEEIDVFAARTTVTAAK